ncbi:MAG: glycosyltransferase, partial [Caulobacteraceae bacterium]
MRIADVSGFYSAVGGGVRSYVRQKFAMARRGGHDLTVIAPAARGGVEERPGGRIVWIAGPPMPFDATYHILWDRAAVWRALDTAAPDVVEGSSPWRGGWIAGRWPGRAVKALVFHQDVVAGYPFVLLDRAMSHAAIDTMFAGWWAWLRRLSAAFDVTVAGGDWLAARLAAHGIGNPIAVPLGIEACRFSPAKRDEGLRRALLAKCGAPPTASLLLAVGRFHPEKRYRTIIDGFAAARAARPDLALAIVGDGLTR